MKTKSVSSVITLFIALTFSVITKGQSFGITASAVYLSDCTQDEYFNTSGSGPSLIGPSSNTFNGNNFGAHTQNSGTLILRGGAVTTNKVPSGSNVCNVTLYYRVYLQSGAPGAFTTMSLTSEEDCNTASSQFSNGRSCANGDQLWYLILADGTTTPSAPVDLTTLAPGNYFVEVYYDVSGSSTSTSLCDETKLLDNSGAYYKASFSIQNPIISGTNPTTCNGSEGYFSITGLIPGTSYAINYTDDGVEAGTANYIANGTGQVVISGLNAGLYSDFTLTANGCTTDLNTGLILSNPVIIPRFTRIAPFCAGSTPPSLPAVSTNGISGAWNPSVIDNQASGTYTFTPTVGQCGTSVSINVTVNPKVTPTFSFGTSLTGCAGLTVPALPTTSTNGITGTWNPSVVDNQVSGVYTFTPSSGQCANPATFTVTVNPNITPSFSFGTSLTICEGAAVPSLPTTSDNGITGSWSPSIVDDQASGTYTFTPGAGQCATTASFTVAVNPNITPVFSFGTALNICNGGAVPTLPTTSDNGVSGIWSPSTVDNQNSGTYTFTPTAGQCATTTTFTVTVNPNITPAFSFGTSLTICNGGTVPTLPATSSNGITGTWNPAVVDDQASATYTFTPAAGQCALTATFTVVVNPNITPAFDFGTSSTICAGGTVPTLPTTSTNGITGTWNPSVVDNQVSGVYAFTPSSGQCATTTTFSVTVNPNITPTFSFGSALTICAGDVVPTLPTTSDNGITGTWNPSIVDNQTSATYTFTPAAGQCATTASFTVTVTQKLTPTFSFGTSLTICEGAAVPSLPTTSDNGINGIWSPSTVDNQNSGTYTFTPTAGQCATSTTLAVTVNPILDPAFNFGNTIDICAGSAVPDLPTTSTNGITGTWNQAAINNQASGTYTFTPAAGQCGNPFTLQVNVSPIIKPIFSFGTTLTICAGASVPVLPGTSANGLTGTWSPAVVSNQNSAVYTFTPDPAQGQCIVNATFSVTVNPILTPTFAFGNSLTLCSGTTAPGLPTTSTNGITGSWNPAVIDNQVAGTYTFTVDPGQCAVNSVTLNVTINPVPTVAEESDTTITDGTVLPARSFTGSPAGLSYNWTNSNTSIGLVASGTGNVPSFTAVNKGSEPVTGIISFTPALNGCSGVASSYKITVLPLDKEVFVPNVFTPNGDGKNEILFVYGNYIAKLNMRIFNQWGEQLFMTDSKTKGWNGTHKGKAQPVGVYVYALEAVLTDGRTIKMKGYINLIR